MEDKQDNSKFLPTNFKSYLGDERENTSDSQLDMFFLRLYPMLERRALYNNMRAYEWATGYVKGVHDTFLSSGLGANVIDVVGRKTIGSKVRLGGTERLPEFEKKLGENFNTKIRKVIDYTVSRGACLARLIVDAKGRVGITETPLGRFRVALNEFNEIIQSETFIETYEEAKKEGATETKVWVIVEKRYYDDENKPKAYYSVRKLSYSGVGLFDDSKNKIEDFEKKDIPDDIKERFKVYEFNKEKELPYNDLGVYLFNNTATNSRYKAVWFGESQLINSLDSLYATDHAFTIKENDKYIGRGRALVPAVMQTQNTPHASNLIRTTMLNTPMANMHQQRKPLDQTFYSEIYNATGTEAFKPTSIQFALRTEEHNTELNRCVQDVCRTARISPSDIDRHLVGNIQRTATEVNKETDNTIGTVDDLRLLITAPLTNMLNTIAEYYQFNALGVFVNWPPSGSSNLATLTPIVVSQNQQKLLSRRTAIKKLNPYWTDEEVDEEITRLDAELDNQSEEDMLSDL